MREGLHQITFIGTDNARKLNIWIENAHFAALAYKTLHKFHKWTFAHIICTGLKAEFREMQRVCLIVEGSSPRHARSACDCCQGCD